MRQISKIDYFVGVFVAAILNSAKSVPALFDETNESKKVEFETNLGQFNAYVKYSTNRKVRKLSLKGKQIEIKYWNIPFSEIEYEKLKSFPKKGCRNCIVMVCTNDTLTKTWVSVLDYDKAMNCLREETPNGNRRIKVTRTGNERLFRCQGVGFKETEYESCPFDYSTYFEKAETEEVVPV